MHDVLLGFLVARCLVPVPSAPLMALSEAIAAGAEAVESDIGIPTSGIPVTKIISAIQFLRNQRREQMMKLPVEDRRKLYPSGTHPQVIAYGL